MPEYRFETIQLHGGQTKEGAPYNARAVPIVSTTSYLFNDSQNAADSFGLEAPSYVYSRIANPTAEVFENRIAQLEGGVGAVATASGQAAQFLALSAVAATGDNIVVSSCLYGGTYNLFKVSFKRIGVEVRFVEGLDPASFEKVADERTRAYYVESVGNPGYDVPDFQALADSAHKLGVPLVVDNTFGGAGYIVRPIDFGVDIVVHSATKWIGGHGTTIGGVVVDSGKFDWNKHADKFPNLTGPSNAYHGMKFTEKFGPAAYIGYVRLEGLRDFGPCLNPFGAFLLTQGLETLSLRLERHQENAAKLAKYFKDSENVTWVSYLGLEEHPSHKVATKYFKNGFGSMISIGVKSTEGSNKAAEVVDKLKLASLLANVGDAKTLVIAPWTTTHSQLTDDEKRASGVTPELIRISVGIEHIDDIIADFEQAFKAVY